MIFKFLFLTEILEKNRRGSFFWPTLHVYSAVHILESKSQHLLRIMHIDYIFYKINLKTFQNPSTFLNKYRVYSRRCNGLDAIHCTAGSPNSCGFSHKPPAGGGWPPRASLGSKMTHPNQINFLKVALLALKLY